MREYLGLPPSPHWAVITYAMTVISSSSGAGQQIQFVWDSRNNKQAGPSRHNTYKRHYNIICVVMRADLGWPPASHWAAITYAMTVISSSSGAGQQIQFVWDSRNNKQAGPSRHNTYKRHYNLVCVVMRADLGWPPASHWAAITYAMTVISSSSGAGQQIQLVSDC